MPIKKYLEVFTLQNVVILWVFLLSWHFSESRNVSDGQEIRCTICLKVFLGFWAPLCIQTEQKVSHMWYPNPWKVWKNVFCGVILSILMLCVRNNLLKWQLCEIKSDFISFLYFIEKIVEKMYIKKLILPLTKYLGLYTFHKGVIWGYLYCPGMLETQEFRYSVGTSVLNNFYYIHYTL